jgi:hypothetical protein
MEYGLVKINSKKQNFKTIIIGYEDGKLLKMKGKVIPWKQYFVGTTHSKYSLIRLSNARYGHLNFDSISQLQK